MLKFNWFLLMPLLLFGCNDKYVIEKKSYESIESDITFFKKKYLEGTQLTALFTGKLVLKKKCLLIENQLGRLYHPVWPNDVSLLLVNGALSIVKNNKVLLKLNQSIKIGGGEVSVINNFKTPKECPYKFWLVQEILD